MIMIIVEVLHHRSCLIRCQMWSNLCEKDDKFGIAIVTICIPVIEVIPKLCEIIKISSSEIYIGMFVVMLKVHGLHHLVQHIHQLPDTYVTII